MPTPSSAETTAAGSNGRLARLLRRAATALSMTFFTALVFAATLAVTMPSSIIGTLVTLPPQVETLSGTLWRGRAGLTGGYSLDWRISARDFWRLRLSAHAELDGADTRLTGKLKLTPWQASATAWSGQAGPGLLTLIPDLSIGVCTSRAIVDISHLAVARRFAAAEGQVEITEGMCSDTAGRAHAVPEAKILLSSEGRSALGILTAEQTLARIELTGDGILKIRVEPAGAALVSGLPTSAPITIEFPIR